MHRFLQNLKFFYNAYSRLEIKRNTIISNLPIRALDWILHVRCHNLKNKKIRTAILPRNYKLTQNARVPVQVVVWMNVLELL